MMAKASSIGGRSSGAGTPRFILSTSPEPPNPAYSIFIANVSRHEIINPDIIPKIESFIKNRFPDVNPVIKKLELGAAAWPPIAIRVSGRDTDTLFNIVDRIKEELRATEGAKQITDSWGTRSKKLIAEIDETRARLAGVTHEDIAISLQTYLTGIEATEYREDDKLIPVILRSANSQREDELGSINVSSQISGSSVPLSQVVQPKLVWQPAKIERRNRLQTVTVEALLEPGHTVKGVLDKLSPWLENESKNWPFGYKYEFGGEAETSGKANEAIAEKTANCRSDYYPVTRCPV